MKTEFRKFVEDLQAREDLDQWDYNMIYGWPKKKRPSHTLSEQNRLAVEELERSRAARAERTRLAWEQEKVKYEQSHPEEAKKIEAEILELIKCFQESEDQWSSDVHRLYPTRQQWEEDPERSAFIHEVYERTGFSVRI